MGDKLGAPLCLSIFRGKHAVSFREGKFNLPRCTTGRMEEGLLIKLNMATVQMDYGFDMIR